MRRDAPAAARLVSRGRVQLQAAQAATDPIRRWTLLDTATLSRMCVVDVVQKIAWLPSAHAHTHHLYHYLHPTIVRARANSLWVAHTHSFLHRAHAALHCVSATHDELSSSPPRDRQRQSSRSWRARAARHTSHRALSARTPESTFRWPAPPQSAAARPASWGSQG